MPNENKKILFVLIVLHLAIALPFAYVLNIWVDEGSTLYTTERGLSYALQTALADEKQAPLYFWFLSVWREINHSIFFARLFSIVCSIAAIKFFYDFAAKLFDLKAAILTTAFFALHPYLIWASVEIRVYSAVVLLSVLLLKSFYEGYFESEKNKAQIYFVLLAVVALYTNYYLGFLLVGNFAALIVCKKFPAAKSYFWQMIIVGVFFAPLLWAMKSQFAANTREFQFEKSLVEGLQILWNFFLTFALPTEVLPPENSTVISFARLWLMRLTILAGIFLFIKNRRKINERFTALAAISAVILGFLFVAYLLLGAGLVEIRHASVLFAPLVLCLGLFLQIVFPDENERYNKFLKTASAILIGGFFLYSIFALYPNLTKRGDWEKVGEFIEQNERPNQPIIVFTAFDAPTLPYHYRGINRILPDEKFFDWGFEAEIGSPDSWRRQTEFTVSEIPTDAAEIWLLTNEKCRKGRACEPLENFVQANYTVIQEKDFYKEKVRLLRKK